MNTPHCGVSVGSMTFQFMFFGSLFFHAAALGCVLSLRACTSTFGVQRTRESERDPDFCQRLCADRATSVPPRHNDIAQRQKNPDTVATGASK